MSLWRGAKKHMATCHLESISQSGPVSLAGTSRGMPSTPMKFRPAPKFGLGSLQAYPCRLIPLDADS